MKILLLGGGGYVGRVICERLYFEEHGLKVLDLFNFSRPNDVARLATVKVGDTRHLKAADFDGIDAVFDLAAISNDPAGELNPALTREINGDARIRGATLARQAGVKRYVLFSSCSVYGANDAVVDERAETNPLTEYAASNVRAESGVLALADDDFCVTAFRLATVFGISQSMRFDLVVNTMSLSAFETGRLTVTGGGQQYRPLVHVADVAKAAVHLLAAPRAAVNGEIFNIAHANMQMHQVAAEVIKGANRPIELVVDDSTLDQRNYRVTNDKARERLGFQAERTVAGGAEAILHALEQGSLARTTTSIRLNGYREMLAGIAL